MKFRFHHIAWVVASSVGLLTVLAPSALSQTGTTAPGAADTTTAPSPGSTDPLAPTAPVGQDSPGNVTGTEVNPPSDPIDTTISPDGTGTTASPYTTGTDAGTGQGYAAGGQEDGFNAELLGLLGLIGLAGLRRKNHNRDRNYENRV